MKKMLLMSVCSAMIVVISAGCTSITTSESAQGVNQPQLVNDCYRAEFSHKNVRVKGDSQINVLFGIFTWGADGMAENSNLSSFSFVPSLSNIAKSAAVYDACQANHADTLLGTHYVVVTTNYLVFKTVKCMVAGFPATMTGLKKLEPFVLRGKEADTLVYLEAPPKIVK